MSSFALVTKSLEAGLVLIGLFFSSQTGSPCLPHSPPESRKDCSQQLCYSPRWDANLHNCSHHPQHDWEHHALVWGGEGRLCGEEGGGEVLRWLEGWTGVDCAVPWGFENWGSNVRESALEALESEFSIPVQATTLGTGEGKSLVSNHCLKSRVSLEGVVVVAFLGGELREGCK